MFYFRFVTEVKSHLGQFQSSLKSFLKTISEAVEQFQSSFGAVARRAPTYFSGQFLRNCNGAVFDHFQEILVQFQSRLG